MKINIEVPDYSPQDGMRFKWEDGFLLESKIIHDTVVIKANREGLVSLARHLLTLADASVPQGYHFHLDDSNSLSAGSCELIFEKE
jgi:hypothetical protein